MTATRRKVLASLLGGSLGLVPLRGHATAPPGLALTPACTGRGEPTLAQSEGPYFAPGSPLRHDLASEVSGGRRITLAGFVLDTACRPQPGALVEIWHADANGAYDNTGFRLRGHQFADDQGRWWFDTIVPAVYPGRTRHVHVKVQRRGGKLLTTQLYFPGEAGNARDWSFDRRLLLAESAAGDAALGRYDFVVG